ncbi:hypothetical protein NLG07_01500 [Alteromonas sp. LMIT006]|jgi:hypothetical protein|uniref:hypothetical protein n=1 Tax=Alteromonadaceae TaxID=72275 RepID=UPI0020CA43A3|nr:hypothetical protein [Alteromonas sp. LMIT006]UTP72938.1 hypothetical protein NLG07_01500 [Alteromonas sp. LMIT006]
MVILLSGASEFAGLFYTFALRTASSIAFDLPSIQVEQQSLVLKLSKLATKLAKLVLI